MDAIKINDLSSAIPPPLNKILLYAVSLDCKSATLDLAESMLSTKEQQRLQRFLQPINKHRFLLGRLSLRLLLARHINLNPEQISIHTTPQGRPYLRDYPWQFSITHSRNWTLIALHPEQAVGIDIEAPRRLYRPSKLLQRLNLAEAQTKDSNALALRNWTLAEACLKATGNGIHQLRNLHAAGPGLWTFKNDISIQARPLNFSLATGYHAAVAQIVGNNKQTA